MFGREGVSMWWCIDDKRLVQVEGMGNGICWCMQGFGWLWDLDVLLVVL